MNKVRKRIFEIIQIGNKSDLPSRIFDVAIVIAILINLTVVLLDTVESAKAFSGVLGALETITVVLFTIEYVLRILTADYLYPKKKKWLAVVCFIFSFAGIIDLITILPYYMPIVFPSGIVAFRMLRVIRILKLFKINQQYDAFNVITDVIVEKKDQIFSSMCLIFMLMIAASLGMYSLEHEAQPEAFKNAFSGLWWAVSTVLTVGYGDIYPITTAGKIAAIIISFLGVGAVAIPTGIVSAGFVEQYTKVRRGIDSCAEHRINYVTCLITDSHPFVNKKVCDIEILPGLSVLGQIKDGDPQSIASDVELKTGDIILIGSDDELDEYNFEGKEIVIDEENEWLGIKVKYLDIKRRDYITAIKRNEEIIIPNGNTIIMLGDRVYMYSRIIKKNRNIK